MIGCFNCPIMVSDNSQLPDYTDYNSTNWFVKNKAVNAPITFEEIVMVMI